MENLSLSELNEYIGRVFALNFEEPLWVHFELSNVKYSRGHVYFDCLEKDDEKDDLLARMSGVIWARQYSFIQKKLKKITDDILQHGVKILAKVVVDFHPVYGLKLVVEDIDPAFTFGTLALEREKTWQRLKEEGLDQRNSLLSPPLAIQRIAILSNDNAAGYVDFVHQLEGNSFGYRYDMTLFETAVQGQRVKTDLPDQIEVINREADDFDLVTVIRGGGSKLDLQAFDQYEVSRAIALCKVPVWVGIGHEIDESLCDLVASRSLKTPTAVASAINEYNYHFDVSLAQINELITQLAHQRIRDEDHRMDEIQYELKKSVMEVLNHKKIDLDRHIQNLVTEKNGLFQRHTWNLNRLSEVVDLLNPESILSKGFAVVENKGRRLHSSAEVKKDDSIKIHLFEGSIDAKVI